MAEGAAFTVKAVYSQTDLMPGFPHFHSLAQPLGHTAVFRIIATTLTDCWKTNSECTPSTDWINLGFLWETNKPPNFTMWKENSFNTPGARS